MHTFLTKIGATTISDVQRGSSVRVPPAGRRALLTMPHVFQTMSAVCRRPKDLAKAKVSKLSLLLRLKHRILPRSLVPSGTRTIQQCGDTHRYQNTWPMRKLRIFRFSVVPPPGLGYQQIKSATLDLVALVAQLIRTHHISERTASSAMNHLRCIICGIATDAVAC